MLLLFPVDNYLQCKKEKKRRLFLLVIVPKYTLKKWEICFRLKREIKFVTENFLLLLEVLYFTFFVTFYWITSFLILNKTEIFYLQYKYRHCNAFLTGIKFKYRLWKYKTMRLCLRCCRLPAVLIYFFRKLFNNFSTSYMMGIPILSVPYSAF